MTRVGALPIPKVCAVNHMAINAFINQKAETHACSKIIITLLLLGLIVVDL